MEMLQNRYKWPTDHSLEVRLCYHSHRALQISMFTLFSSLCLFSKKCRTRILKATFKQFLCSDIIKKNPHQNLLPFSKYFTNENVSFFVYFPQLFFVVLLFLRGPIFFLRPTFFLVHQIILLLLPFSSPRPSPFSLIRVLLQSEINT